MQVLAKLDPKDLQTNVDSAQAQVVAEQARVKQTAAAFVRQEKPSSPLCQHVPVFAGGPVMIDRGFVLHPASMNFDATVELDDGLALSTSADALFSIADGRGPNRSSLGVSNRI